ncbi:MULTISPECIES: pyridoxamine 5'-phosphate oxidase [unclassified Brevibacterium]|uniref:pyridoxamine 5'-phosphate oxidase n=1 Tax=unclassified Brevibacterium TaxID=2614124 RepID=UPI0010F6713D|nr:MULTISPECIES: pyridoxamine 5'-phosphate oxidase [unclassified Brevibacterium]MCM1011498.1 pyridoxamine 5'-phosphate oxidase [Brevibacterium sp. XM4083]
MSEPVDRLAQTRASYISSSFDRPEVSPLDLFRTWYDEAAGQVREPNAMTVSTLDDWGPVARIVLLKAVDAAGFVFFTDYDSAKGRQLAADPRIAASFPWQDMHRQIRIRGIAEAVAAAESDAYFAVRPRGSQIAASVSKQSQPVSGREQMEAEYDAAVTEFEGREVPRPAHWGGFRIRPFEIEFWQGQENRFHDRWVFRRADGSHDPGDLAAADQWELVRLYP